MGQKFKVDAVEQGKSAERFKEEADMDKTMRKNETGD